LTVTASVLSGNTATEQGGGLYCEEDSEAFLINSIFVGNSAGIDGGAISADGSAVTVTNSTLAANVAGAKGGGVYGPTSSLALANTILSLNEAASGADLYGMMGPGSGAVLMGMDPGFVRAPDDGGDGWGDDPTTTEIDESANDDLGDVHLRVDSPAVNAGINALAVDAEGQSLETDLDGKQRIIYGTVDLGAYEFCLPGDANYDGAVDDIDAEILATNWGALFKLLPGDADRDGLVDSGDKVTLAQNWGTEGAAWSQGDFDGDGLVGPRDAAILGAQWGKTSGRVTWDDGDFDGDGLVGPGDAWILGANWGATFDWSGEASAAAGSVPADAAATVAGSIGPVAAGTRTTTRRLLRPAPGREVEASAAPESKPAAAPEVVESAHDAALAQQWGFAVEQTRAAQHRETRRIALAPRHVDPLLAEYF
ncbi:MAG: hypothetical protein JW888_09135, partial [Pirellulales bacterium]|nr:hypothetical protein [Pirellulales bacterium]